MIANISNQKFVKDSLMEDSTASYRLSGCCRYNLRNRGPPIFTALAEKECPICLSEVFEKPVVVNCGHTFCDQCIRLAMAKHKSCPLCNQVLIESLFLSDTSYTRKLTRKNRSPDRTKIQIFSSVGKYVNTTLPIVTKTSKPQAQAPNRKSTISKNLRKTRV